LDIIIESSFWEVDLGNNFWKIGFLIIGYFGVYLPIVLEFDQKYPKHIPTFSLCRYTNEELKNSLVDVKKNDREMKKSENAFNRWSCWSNPKLGKKLCQSIQFILKGNRHAD